MKRFFLNKWMKCIRSSSLSYSDEKLEEIEYGLEAIYILITKSIIIFGIAYLLGVFKPLFIFLIIYTIIRMPSFGLHATKSYVCLVGSFAIFMLGMYLSLVTIIPIYIKALLGIYCIIRIYQNAPADTYKRPIVNQKRRDAYKFISTIIAITYVFTSLIIPHTFIGNSLILTLCIQVCMISPYIYRLFNLPYNNYKIYNLNNGLN